MSVRDTVPVIGRVIAKSQISNGMTGAASTKNSVSSAVFGSTTDDFCLFRVVWSIVLNKLKFVYRSAVRTSGILKGGLWRF
ncbi:hypothetical protein QUA62_15875 [Microcoleus sp. MON1_C1]|uniref:hypothetical protein n=1 Tax=Microcoleus sp. MON1_C1 TaxID=2818827 RepID=UPI002FCE8D96